MAVKTILPSYPHATLVPRGRYSQLAPVSIARPLTIIGSSDHVHVRLRSRTISPAHAMLLNVDGRILIRDLCSDFRVTVNRREVREAMLKEGDVVRIGRIRFAVSLGQRSDEPLEPDAADARLWNDSGEAVPISSSTFVLGSARDADLVLPEGVPPANAVIFVIGRHRFVRNLRPETPLRLNEGEFRQTVLMSGDVIDVHNHRFQYDASPIQRPVEVPVVTAVKTLGMPIATDVPVHAQQESCEETSPTTCAVVPENGGDDRSDPFADVQPESNQTDDQPTTQRDRVDVEQRDFDQHDFEPRDAAVVDPMPSVAPSPRVEVESDERIAVEDGDLDDLAVDTASDSTSASLDPNLLHNARALGPLAVALLAQRGATLAPPPVAPAAKPPSRKSHPWRRISVALIIASAIGLGIWWGLAHRAIM